MFLQWILVILVTLNSVHSQQYYDPSDCSADAIYPGSRYTCSNSSNDDQSSCSTYLVYRANQHFRTVSDVSQLLQVDPDVLLRSSNLTSPFTILEPGTEVVVPKTCSCTGEFFQADFSYVVPENTTISGVACAAFEGLLKSRTLLEENTASKNDVMAGTKLRVPLRCACPNISTSDSGVQYLVTYPVVEGDGPTKICQKFGISTEELRAANHLETRPTIYPNTTILIPLKGRPVINFSAATSPPPTPGFVPTITVQKATGPKLRNLYIAGSVVGFSLVVAVLVASGLYVKTLRKQKFDKLQSFNTRSSPLSCSTPRSSPRSGLTGRSSTASCLSPDLLVGIKFSLKNYSLEDLRGATRDFSEETKIGDHTYKALIDNVGFMIQQMKFEDTRQVIDIHSKINHINIVNLIGVCYGENDFAWSYLVFELPSNGCLRDLLSDSSSPLPWIKRTQIAFDIVTGLHYLHNCIFPSYAHMNVSSRNIFITSNWRAKLTSIRVNSSGASSKGNEGGCFEQLRSFMDPCLKEDYSLAEALCLAVLAAACVQDDPLHRPSVDDILKVLVRMV
ncbi:hypothetical protein Tsubulata_006398 [Turnera subulata]|uniref:Protein kinase domain-containing protein n=1 Tax=Turnera subulata TaxID=218843 RepID=A0A9Q0F1H2_9ROSI|nr:hypothetical protein Tsubulata_006398 [Turnera subulata]